MWDVLFVESHLNTSHRSDLIWLKVKSFEKKKLEIILIKSVSFHYITVYPEFWSCTVKNDKCRIDYYPNNFSKMVEK